MSWCCPLQGPQEHRRVTTMDLNLPIADEDELWLFERTVRQLQTRHGHAEALALELVRRYYLRFTDERYCDDFNLRVQTMEFFQREESLNLADRVHYHAFLQNTPDEASFIRWQREFCGLDGRG